MAAREDPPKYRLIAEDLRARMESGEYPPGSRLPSKSELMEQYSVALATINGALGVLRGEGRLETIHGRGTFATEPPDDQAGGGVADQVMQLGQRLDAVEAWIAQHDRLARRGPRVPRRGKPAEPDTSR